MGKLTKRKKAIKAALGERKLRTSEEAFELLKSMPAAKFDESVDVSINLGVDPRKSDQMVRSSTVLPNGTGKTVRVAVFAQGKAAEDAQAAGADLVGFADLVAQVKGGAINFDLVIATPDAMPVVGQLGPLLGPRGLMPNPKVGTVTTDVVTAVKNAKGGQVRYRIDKGGIIHCPIGKVSFGSMRLKENLEVLIKDLVKAKPSTSKGVYLRKVSVSATMGPGIVLDKAGLPV